MCFPELSSSLSAGEQLELSRANIDAFTPATVNQRKFNQSPFIPPNIRNADYLFIRVDNLAKPVLAQHYTGPFRVLEKNFKESRFAVQLGRGVDKISLSRLKAATPASS